VGAKVRSRSLSKKIEGIARELSSQCDALSFAGKVSLVYNPLDYAWDAHAQYLRRFGGRKGVAILLGMNPGPFGMAQTGVPFGEVASVRDWMGITSDIVGPAVQHPKRPIDGFACKRSEVSGSRLWGWGRDHFETPDAFADSFFVWNYCPLCFMVESGANYTPDKLSPGERKDLYDVCNRALLAVVEAIEPKAVIGVGKFAEKRAKLALGPGAPPIGTVLHPSPASPMANRGWAPQAHAQLDTLGLL
jgi:single-strand selective monofunctional uracil DNA glycosylase